jgi:hypothetical protein
MLGCQKAARQINQMQKCGIGRLGSAESIRRDIESERWYLLATRYFNPYLSLINNAEKLITKSEKYNATNL